MIDLHTHTHYSDGDLSPQALLNLAQGSGLTMLAITDHDCIDGALEAKPLAHSMGLRLIPGIEFSTCWKKHEIHIIGLDFDVNTAYLKETIEGQIQRRQQRAQTIVDRLQGAGLEISWNELQSLAKNKLITRPHVAQYLVRAGYCKDIKAAFDRYLKRGRLAYVPTPWIGIEDAIQCIHQAKGKAILAHPLRYGLTKTKVRELVETFTTCGGDGIEVISFRQRDNETHELLNLSLEYNLYISIGSDFHSSRFHHRLLNHERLSASKRGIWLTFDEA